MKTTTILAALALAGVLSLQFVLFGGDPEPPAEIGVPPESSSTGMDPAVPPVQSQVDEMRRMEAAEAAYEHFQKQHVQKRLDEAGVSLPDLNRDFVVLTADSPYQKISTEAAQEFAEIWERDREKLIEEYLELR